MTDRRRNGLILLLVPGLLLASSSSIAPKPTRLGLDLKGGVELVYQGEPTQQVPKVTPEALDRAVDIIRERVDQLGVGEPEIQRSGSNQISVGLPDVQNIRRAQEQVGTPAQLYFYDWEANVLTPDGRPVAPQLPTSRPTRSGSARRRATQARASRSTTPSSSRRDRRRHTAARASAPPTTCSTASTATSPVPSARPRPALGDLKTSCRPAARC